MYLDSIAEQSRVFLYACGFGFALGILYDFFAFVRCCVGKGKKLIFWQDVVYMTVSAFLTFIFSLAVNNGKAEMYFFVGIFLGWMIYYFAFGLIALKIIEKTSDVFGRVFLFIHDRIKNTCLRIRTKRKKLKGKRKKKTEKSSKILLQDDNELLYNKFNRTRKRTRKRKKEVRQK